MAKSTSTLTLSQAASDSLSAELETSRLNIIFLNRHSCEMSILNGQMDPIGGWYSRYYGSKVAAPTVTGRMKVQLPSGVITAVKSSAGALSVPQDIPGPFRRTWICAATACLCWIAELTWETALCALHLAQIRSALTDMPSGSRNCNKAAERGLMQVTSPSQSPLRTRRGTERA
jgi:hypothetical protein